MRLYQIDSELRLLDQMIEEWAQEHEGDITDFPLNEELDKLNISRENKILGLAVLYKELSGEAAAIREEEKAQAKRRQALERRADRLSAFIQSTLPAGEKLADSRAALTWRKSSVVEVPAELTAEAIQAAYPGAVKVKIEASKTELKTLLKTAGELSVSQDGKEYKITQIDKQNLQIK